MNQARMNAPVGLYVTEKMVGREKLLDQIRQEFKNPAVKAFVIHGAGGIGKTRLLKEAKEIAREMGYRVDERKDALLDLYDIQLHTAFGLAEKIHETIAEFSEMREYVQAAEDLNEMRVFFGEVDDIDEREKNALDSLKDGLKKVAAEQKIVLTIDTVERAVYGLPGLSADVSLADSMEWLLQTLNQVENVVVLLAGRPTAEPLFEKYRATLGDAVVELPIQPFDQAETLAYFKEVRKLAIEKNVPEVADLLQKMPSENKELVHAYANGSPILLSLVVDHVLMYGTGDLNTLFGEFRSDSPTPEEREQFEAQLFNRLIQSPQVGDMLVALGRLPRGAGKSLLAKILEQDELTTERAIGEIKRYSFVKIRPGDPRIFLHDEMYALLNKHVFSYPVDINSAQKVFTKIKEHYNAIRDNEIKELDKLYFPIEKDSKGVITKKLILDRHNQYQLILMDMMYYFLHEDAGRGMRNYYRYSHEAVMARDILFDMQLQTEINDFISRQSVEISKDVAGSNKEQIRLDEICSLLRVRQVCRKWAIGNYQDAITDGEEIYAELQIKKVPISSFAVIIWIMHSYVRRAKGEDYQEALKYWLKIPYLLPKLKLSEKMIVTKESFEQLRDEYSETELWYIKALIAYGYRVIAYAYRVQGKMLEAVDFYTRAATILRELDIRVEMATTLNDLSFVQAELGRWSDAHALVQKAIELRRELGHRVPVAYSLNTLAAIEIREGDYANARNHSGIALTIFREFEEFRGKGLANIVYAEACRRSAVERYTRSTSEKYDFLRSAEAAAEAASDIFDLNAENNTKNNRRDRFAKIGSDKKIDERDRLVEALIEYGCVFRDKVNLSLSEDNYDPTIDKKNLIQRSEYLFDLASEKADSDNLRYRKLDALVNKAWLYYYCLGDEDTEVYYKRLVQIMNEIEEEFPSEYIIKDDGSCTIDKENAQSAIWLQLGKLYALKGHLAYRDYDRESKSDKKILAESVVSALKEMSNYYHISLEYSALFSTSYHGIDRAKLGIYNRLVKLNDRELFVVCETINNKKEKSIFKEMLVNRALWQE